MMRKNLIQQITETKIEIDDLIEYLHSDVCRECGEVAIKLDNSLKQLQILLEKQTDENSSN
jgi:hypothetical protein